MSGGGLSGTFGYKPETTYATYVAPDHFLQVATAQVKRVPNRVVGVGLDGNSFNRGSRQQELSRHGAGPITTLVYNKNMGALLKQIFGASSGPTQQAATAAYLTTFATTATTSPDGLTMSMQAALPQRNGTKVQRSMVGAKVLSAEFACSIDNYLMLNMDVWCQDLPTQTLTAVSYPTSQNPFHWGQFAYTIGAYGSEAAVSGVRGFSVKLTWAVDDTAYYAGTTPLAAEPVLNDKATVTGTVDADYVLDADFQARFVANSNFSQIFTFTGPNIESTYNETFALAIPYSKFTDGIDGLSGPGVLNASYPFEGFYDDTHTVITATTMSRDTAL